MHFWALPGPQGFLEEVVQCLNVGSSVVLAIPAFGPPDVMDALGERIRGRWFWDVVSPPEDKNPAAFIAEHFIYNGEGSLHDVVSVASSPDLEGRAIGVHGVGASAWPRWRQFIEEFSEVSRNRSEAERALLL